MDSTGDQSRYRDDGISNAGRLLDSVSVGPAKAPHDPNQTHSVVAGRLDSTAMRRDGVGGRPGTIANSLSAAQTLVELFEAWCDWAKMDIRIDKCLSFGAVMKDGKYQQILPSIGLRDKGLIPAVPVGGHFKYLGKFFDFPSLNAEPKREFESKLVKILDKISSLQIRCETKLKIFSLYVPSQFNFELKIYNFTDAFLSGVIERLCTRNIREWLEFPPSSCVTEWASSPVNYCGLGSLRERPE